MGSFTCYGGQQQYAVKRGADGHLAVVRSLDERRKEQDRHQLVPLTGTDRG